MNLGVKGLGGVFLYAEDPAGLSRWYATHFGLAFIEWEPGTCYGLEFTYTDPDGAKGHTVFSFQKAKAPLGAGRPECMVNWRVADLEAFCARLEAEGVPVESREDCGYGRFAWIRDPEGHRVELYQPLQEPGTF
ncbi:MAG: VOC family protein [Geothrix sp.]|nr:VOC family protein [Geothrix sp.]